VDWLSDIAVFVAAWGGVGAFADFFLGKTGQKRVREAMETWWIMLSDVELRTFGAREARLAATLLEKMFGTFWSWKRLRAVMIVLLATTLVWGAGRAANLFSGAGEPYSVPFDWKALPPAVFSIMSFWWATSLNIVLARMLAGYGATSSGRGAVVYVLLMICQLALITVSYELQMAVIFTFINEGGPGTGFYAGIGPANGRAYLQAYLSNLHWLLDHIWLDAVLEFFGIGLGGGGGLVTHYVTVFLYLAAMIRLGILILFSFSFLLRPAQRVLSLIIERLVESDRPILTFIFGSTAAIAKTLHAFF